LGLSGKAANRQSTGWTENAMGDCWQEREGDGMNWISDDINALFALYLHKLEQVEPLVVFKLTLLAGCLIALIVGFWGGMAPLIVAWTEEWIRRKEKEKEKKGVSHEKR
jgi:hypothetical protein